MKQTITNLVLAFAFVMTATLAPLAQAEVTATTTATTTQTVATTTTTATTTPATNSTVAGLLAQLAKLTSLFNELKAKLMGTQAEIKELRADIREGMTDADVKTIQELLASDPTIYPKGIVSGFFGPMTKEAVMKFQAKNGLEVTGEINAETKAAFDTLIEARRAEGKFPLGLLLAPGLKDKFKERFHKRCEGAAASSTMAMMCDRVKEKHGDKEDKKDWKIDEMSTSTKKMMDDKKQEERMKENKQGENVKTSSSTKPVFKPTGTHIPTADL